ncbi:hypothetical protein [Streptomyces spinosisporus]|uniref:Transposase n=1 Tax=Streptomyces spinosisporus TaxID=2927582 RepID=A0ABS9XUI2_9ACTN|nr:hypothetical protein [Streptomyces spinosisporus]MCI3245732.1 hypothetical protein [Streptomyces spinosisporus]
MPVRIHKARHHQLVCSIDDLFVADSGGRVAKAGDAAIPDQDIGDPAHPVREEDVTASQQEGLGHGSV